MRSYLYSYHRHRPEHGRPHRHYRLYHHFSIIVIGLTYRLSCANSSSSYSFFFRASVLTAERFFRLFCIYHLNFFFSIFADCQQLSSRAKETHILTSIKIRFLIVSKPNIYFRRISMTQIQRETHQTANQIDS